MAPPYSPARLVAARVIHRVAIESAWAAPTLDVELREQRLPERDAALATAIAYGTLRVLPSLDHAIEEHLARKSGLDHFTRAALRTAAYQLRHMRTAPHAVVSDTVSMIKARRGEGLSRFANAVLRKLASARPAEPKEPSEIEVPEWLRQEIEASFGSSRARDFLSARPLPPPLSLRVRGDREAFAAAVREARPGATVTLASLSPVGVYVSKAGDPRDLPGYSEGMFSVQDEGSQLIGALAMPEPALRIVDACAGRGGKTTYFAAQMQGHGRLAAIDVHESKLERIAGELERMHIASDLLELHPIDLSVGTGGLSAEFDRVLVDAPCTGLGTIHRRPEILLRVQAGDPKRMATLQLSILHNASKLVAPAGVLIYSVCSPTRVEGAEVAARFEAQHPDFVRVPSSVPGLEADDDEVMRIGPFGAASGAGPDAYQLVRWRKRD